MRFVEWFTERGVSYEHNMQVIDKHIGNLAKANHPKLREPYSGQIRFTPINSSINNKNTSFVEEKINKLSVEDKNTTGRPVNNWNL